MPMRWPNGSAERKIEAFIGAWGVKTGDIADTDHLMELASRLFEVANNGIPERMSATIDGLGAKRRRALAQKNLRDVMGSEGRFDANWSSAPTAAAVPSGPVTEEGLQRIMDAAAPKMIDGQPFNVVGELDIDPAKLLQKVVSAVISAGRADILWEFPEVLAFFGSRIPDRSEVAHLHNVDERMFEAAAKWPNRGKT